MRIAPMRIMHMLDAKGYRTSYGRWKRKGIQRIVANRTYVGDVSYAGKWYKGTHEAIIDQETFDKSQEILADHLNSHRRKPKYASPIAGLVECKKCGNNYYIRTDGYLKDGTRSRSFTCYARTCYHGKWAKIPKNERCKNNNWRVDALEKVVFDEINKLALHPDTFESVDRPNENADKIKAIDKRINEINKHLDRFLELYAEGIFDIGKVKSKVDPLEEEKAQLTHELKKLKTAPKLDKSEAVELALSVADLMSEGNTDELRATINELIDAIVIDGDIAHIYWKF